MLAHKRITIQTTKKRMSETRDIYHTALRNANVGSSTSEENPFYIGSDAEMSISVANPNDESRCDRYNMR